MKKEIYLLDGLENEDYTAFHKRVHALNKQILSLQSINSAKVTYTQSPPPALTIIPFKKKKVAAFSVVHDESNTILRLMKDHGAKSAYAVDEAIPVAYEKSWEDLTPTPGICLLTLFKKRKDLSFETFLDRWHYGHTPLSLKIHPLWNYNRNVVTKKILAESTPWDGIVEEQFRTTSDLLNPIKFFGNPFIMPYRMWQVYSDTRGFLDYSTIEPYFAIEVWIKSK
jgi:hypothetical protein